jgi:hypothetical protein
LRGAGTPARVFWLDFEPVEMTRECEKNIERDS